MNEFEEEEFDLDGYLEIATIDDIVYGIEQFRIIEAQRIIDSIPIDQRAQYVAELRNEDRKLLMIKNLREEERLQCIDKLKYLRNKIEIIQTLTDEKQQIECIDRITDDIDKSTDEYYKVEMINSLPIVGQRIKWIKEFTEDQFKFAIIQKLPDDRKIEWIKELKNDNWKFEIVKTLPEKERIQCIDEFTDEYKVKIINSLPEEQRIGWIKKLTNEYYKAEIIKTLSVDKRIQCIDELTDEYKVKIINSLPVEQRIQYIDKMTEGGKCAIIISLPEEQKIQYIDIFTNDIYKIGLLSSLTEEMIEHNIDKCFKNNIENFNKVRNNFGISYKELLTLILLSEGYYNNFMELISDDVKTAKFVEIFNEQNFILEKKHIDTALEAILSEEFKLRNNDIWEIFSRTKALCDKYDVAGVTQVLMDIIKYSQSTSNLVGRELKQFIDEYIDNPDMLKQFIIELVNKNGNEEALNKLKIIASQYINLHMETYKIRRKKDIYDNNLLSIDMKIERNYLIKYIIEHNDLDMIISLIDKFYPEKLLPSYLNDVNGITIRNVLEWKKDRPQEAPKEIKKYFKVLNSIFVDLYNEHYEDISSLISKDETNIKYDDKYRIDGRISNMIPLSNGLISLLQKENEEEYKVIKSLIEKYHLIGFGNVFDYVKPLVPGHVL